MYFEDLTPYRYMAAVEGLLNVGWLEAGHEFTQGAVPADFVDALWGFCRRPAQQTRGLHYCDLAPACADRICRVTHGDEQLLLGSAEIWVFGTDAAAFASPTLVFHYVTEHQYRPPDPFVHAVLDGPRPESTSYQDQLRPLGESLDRARRPAPRSRPR